MLLAAASLALLGCGVVLVLPKRYLFEDIEFWEDKGILEGIGALDIDLIEKVRKDGKAAKAELVMILRNSGDEPVDLSSLLSRVNNGRIVIEFLTHARVTYYDDQDSPFGKVARDYEYFGETHDFCSLKKIPEVPAHGEVSIDLKFTYWRDDPKKWGTHVLVPAPPEEIRPHIASKFYNSIEISLFETDGTRIIVQEPLYSSHRLPLKAFFLHPEKDKGKLKPIPGAGYLPYKNNQRRR